MARLCKNIQTGLIFWWNEQLKNDPDIVLLSEEEEKKILGKERKQVAKAKDIEEKAENIENLLS